MPMDKEMLKMFLAKALQKGAGAAEGLGKLGASGMRRGAGAVESLGPMLSAKMHSGSEMMGRNPKMSGAGMGGGGLLALLAAKHHAEEEPMDDHAHEDSGPSDDDYMEMLKKIHDKQLESEGQSKKNSLGIF